jgi:serine/threonine protein kinase/tetratricopeptide (TPR) repeat protein
MSQPREITESFRLERVLKSSRYAIVFQAVDPATGSPVAIKLIPPGSKADPDECRTRFLAAMEALQAQHPACFPRLLDYGFTPDASAFMVMELVAGTRLDTMTGASPVSVLRLLAAAARGLAELAGKGTSHGNLAPENLLVTRHGEDEQVKVLGFGTVAFQIGALAGASLTLEGPPQFAAPERLEPLTASAKPDARSDVYSLALTACALLHAEVAPADAPAPSVLLPGQVTHLIKDPVLLRSALERAVRRDAAERPASLEEFCQALVGAVSGTQKEVVHARVPVQEPALDEPFGGTPPRVLETPRVPAPPQILPPPPVLAAPPAVAEGTLTMPTFPAPPPPPPAPAAPLPFTPSAHPGPPPSPPGPRRERVQTGPVPVHRLPEIPSPPPTAAPPTEPPPFAPEAALPTASPTATDAVAVPVPTPEPTPEPAPAPRPHTAATKRRSGSRLPLWLGLTAGVLIAIAVVAVMFLRQTRRPERAAALPTPALAKPTQPAKPLAVPRAATALQTAEATLALGDLVAAGQALKSITPTELDTLSVAERERYDTLLATYATQTERALAKDLATHLATGNLKALAETVKGISREDEAAYAHNADISAALEEARRALNIQALTLKAQKQGEWGEVLQQSTVLASLVPRYTAASELREKAAGVLEREAHDLAAKGNYELALTRLETLRRSWPNRQGLGARFERLRADQAADQKLGAVMAAVEQAEKEQAPEKGLELLAATTPNPRYEARFQQARERLTVQLKQLDPGPPTVAITPGAKLEYKKGEPGAINVRVTDDHAVKSARLFARVEGSTQFTELPLRRASGSDYVAEISVNFHQNKTVEFYVVASDYSDHTAQLGSPKEPLKLKRKKWSLFGG